MSLKQREGLRLSPGVAIVQRSKSSVQVGTDPRTSFVVEGLDAVELSYLNQVGQTRAWLPTLTGARLEAVARQLEARGLLLPESQWRGAVFPRPAQGTVGVIGDGPLTDFIAAALSACQITVITPDHYFGDDPVDQAEQLAAWTVVMVDRHVADPVRARSLMSSQTPHLSVVEREASIGIGPFVYPGVSTCLRCVDLHRLDVDKDWALVAAQLMSSSMPEPHLPEHIQRAAASLVASQVRLHVEGRRPPTAWHPEHQYGGSIIDLPDPSGVPKIGYVTAHPVCGCLGLNDLEHASGTGGS